MFYIVFSLVYLMRVYSILSFRVRLCSIRKEYLCQNALQRFHFLSNLLRSSSLPTYSSRRLLTKSKTCTVGGASLKNEKYIKFFFFLQRLREYFQWFTESHMKRICCELGCSEFNK